MEQHIEGKRLVNPWQGSPGRDRWVVSGTTKTSRDATQGDLRLSRQGCWRMLRSEGKAPIGNSGSSMEIHSCHYQS